MPFSRIRHFKAQPVSHDRGLRFLIYSVPISKKKSYMYATFSLETGPVVPQHPQGYKSEK